jgi:hypothetical protein
MPTLEEKVDSLLDRTARIETALKFDGEGLIPAFNEHCKNDKKFRDGFYRFRMWGIIILLLMLVANGFDVPGLIKIALAGS